MFGHATSMSIIHVATDVANLVTCSDGLQPTSDGLQPIVAIIHPNQPVLQRIMIYVDFDRSVLGWTCWLFFAGLLEGSVRLWYVQVRIDSKRLVDTYTSFRSEASYAKCGRREKSPNWLFQSRRTPPNSQGFYMKSRIILEWEYTHIKWRFKTIFETSLKTPIAHPFLSKFPPLSPSYLPIISHPSEAH